MSVSDPYAAPEVVETETKTETATETETVPEGTIEELLNWVDGNKERAQLALDAEKDGKNRKTVLTKLEEILAND